MRKESTRRRRRRYSTEKEKNLKNTYACILEHRHHLQDCVWVSTVRGQLKASKPNCCTKQSISCSVTTACSCSGWEGESSLLRDVTSLSAIPQGTMCWKKLKSGAMLNAKPCEVMLPEETLTPTAPIFFLLSDTQTPVSFTILPLAVMP